jgi:hypothetical protein
MIEMDFFEFLSQPAYVREWETDDGPSEETKELKEQNRLLRIALKKLENQQRLPMKRVREVESKMRLIR